MLNLLIVLKILFERLFCAIIRIDTHGHAFVASSLAA